VVSAELTDVVELNYQHCSQQTKDKFISKYCTLFDAKAGSRNEIMFEKVSYADDSMSSVIKHIKNMLFFNVQFRKHPWSFGLLIIPK
jgi:hypothetical protein